MEGLITIAPIVGICYILGTGIKQTNLVDAKWIPLILGILGGFLGIACFCSMSDFPATSLIEAIAYGMFSGWTSTGINQVYKQLQDGGETDE